MNDVQLVRIGDLLYAVKKRWKLILALTVFGIVVGLVLSGISYLQGGYTSYVIYSSIAISPQSDSDVYNGNYGYSAQTDFHLAEDMVDAAQYILKSSRVLNAAIQTTGLGSITSTELSQNLEVTRYNETQILELSLYWNDPEAGLQLMGAIVDACKVALPETFLFNCTVTTIEEPSSVRYTSGGVDSRTWLLVILLGPVIGVGLAILEMLMRPTLLNLRDVEAVLGLETLGTIPKNDAYFRKGGLLLENDDNSNSALEQNFASAAYIINNRFGTRERHHCFYVTSAEDGEGRSTVTANLALQLADMEKHVLLIDLDTHNPSLAGMFLYSVDYDRTLNALYKGDAIAQDAIVSLTGHLDFLPTVLERTPVPIDGTLLEFIRDIQSSYDYVLIDAPSINQAASEVFSLNQVAGAALFVVRYDTIPIHDVDEAIDKLDKSGIRILGCLVNASQASQNFSFWGDRGADVTPRRMRKEPASPAMGDEMPAVGNEEALVPAVGNSSDEAWKPKKTSDKPRSVMDELTDDYSKDRNTLTDSEALTELIRMGASGSWKKDSSDEAEDKSAVAPELAEADVPAALPSNEPEPAMVRDPAQNAPSKDAATKEPLRSGTQGIVFASEGRTNDSTAATASADTQPEAVEAAEQSKKQQPVQEKDAVTQTVTTSTYEHTKKRSLFGKRSKPKH